MILRASGRQGARMRRRQGTIALGAIAMALMVGAVSLPAMAQSLNDSLAGRAQQGGRPQDRLLVEAKEIVYDNDRNTVALTGDVELYFQGRTLQADRVTYDRNTGRVFAEGNARLTEAGGAVVTGSRFELTDDFKNGFIDSLRVEQTVTLGGQSVKARFSAPRAERIEGEQTVFERGTYTACEACKDAPERPPLWQVKAARIIHNNSERTIYYENATLEIAGIPVAYMPYFWTPDPTVKRKTGFLTPRYVSSPSLGYGATIPFFWATAQNHDLTIEPTFLTRQGVLGQAEWRHRLETGSYNIRGAGIFQLDGSAYLPSPLGARDREMRGSLETTGLFHLNQRWHWGWDIALLSDKWFLSNYRIRSESLSQTYFRESISTLFLTGQGDRSFFDVRGYYFNGLSTDDFQKQLPVVHPVLDYNKRINGPQPLGGEVAVDVNLTSLTREVPQFQGLPRNNSALYTIRNFDGGFDRGFHNTCTVFERGRCLVRGISGTATRLTAQASWRRTFTDPIGQVWTPFSYLRGDGFYVAPDQTGVANTQLAQSGQLANFIGTDDYFAGRAMPAVGVEYRYPFVADAGVIGLHTIEPIAQVIARPNETKIGRLPNEDAQSLVFDDSSIFDWDKFSGYDRVEGGTRANLGARYSVATLGGFNANALAGQSIQLAGLNSFASRDLLNTGRDSGLDNNFSDYVGRIQVSKDSYSFVARGRFDQDDLSTKRLEVGASASLNPYLPISGSLLYARYAAQPETGALRPREGLSTSATWSVTPNWSVSGSVIFDLDRYLQARETFVEAYDRYLANPVNMTVPTYKREDQFYVAGVSLGLSYVDECTTLAISYSIDPNAVATGTKERNSLVMVRLELRSLGQANFKQDLGLPSTQDGIASR